MKKAPNLKQQPADRFTEQVIFAGADAWVHAKDWQHNNRAGDTVPPVVLAGRELDNLHKTMPRILLLADARCRR